MKNAILINPYQKIAGEKAFFIGLIACVAQVLMGYFFQTHFDGILDTHYGKVESLVDSISEMLINLFSMYLFFGLAGKWILNSRMRWIDLLGTMTFSRIPLLILPLFNFTGYFSRIGDNIENELKAGKIVFPKADEMMWLIGIGIFSTLFIIWYITWMFQAFKTTANGKGGKFIFTFIACVLLAEIMSKILIYQFLK